MFVMIIFLLTKIEFGSSYEKKSDIPKSIKNQLDVIITKSEFKPLKSISIDLLKAGHQTNGKIHQGYDNVLGFPSCFLNNRKFIINHHVGHFLWKRRKITLKTSCISRKVMSLSQFNKNVVLTANLPKYQFLFQASIQRPACKCCRWF